MLVPGVHSSDLELLEVPLLVPLDRFRQLLARRRRGRPLRLKVQLALLQVPRARRRQTSRAFQSCYSRQGASFENGHKIRPRSTDADMPGASVKILAQFHCSLPRSTDADMPGASVKILAQFQNCSHKMGRLGMHPLRSLPRSTDADMPGASFNILAQFQNCSRAHGKVDLRRDRTAVDALSSALDALSSV